MATKRTPEQRIARALRTILEAIAPDSEFVESPEMQDVVVGLEYFLPAILAEVYSYWKSESLDGLFLSEARKTDAAQVELRGICILISDQAITPFHLRMQISSSEDRIEWMECRLGKQGAGKGGMERIPWSQWHGHSYTFLQKSLDPIKWTYTVAFGKEALALRQGEYQAGSNLGKHKGDIT